MAEDGGVSIRNCRFAYKCSRNWNGLRLTAVPGERFCGECNRTVYFCETDSHLTEAIRLDRCIAILDEVMHNGKPIRIHTMGVPGPYSEDDGDENPF